MHAVVVHVKQTFFQANNLVLHTAVEYFRRNCKAQEQGDGQQSRSKGLPHIITSNVEHVSVNLVAEHLKKDGQAGRRPSCKVSFKSNLKKKKILLLTNLKMFLDLSLTDVTFVPVSKVTARVEVEDIIAAVRPNTCLISIMMANNETGIIMVRKRQTFGYLTASSVLTCMCISLQH